MQVREALARALEAGRPPFFYLDTNVIRDIIKGRKRSSTELLDLLKTKKWLSATAHFTYMEIFDIEQEARHFRQKLDEGLEINAIWASRRGRDLDRETLRQIETEIYQGIRNRYELIEWSYLDKDGWDRAIELAAESNLPAPDCIHLATALMAGCDVLVTSDGHLSRNARAYIASGQLDQVLKESKLLAASDQ